MYKGLVSLSCLVAGLLHRLLLHIPSTLPSLIRPMPPASRVFHTSLDPVPLLSIFLRELVTLNLSQTCHYQICHSNSRLTYHVFCSCAHSWEELTRELRVRAELTRELQARGRTATRVNFRGPQGRAQVYVARVFTPTNSQVMRLRVLHVICTVHTFHFWV